MTFYGTPHGAIDCQLTNISLDKRGTGQEYRDIVRVYWGIYEILKRMQWGCYATMIRHIVNDGFPAYKRRRGNHSRLWWYSTEPMINGYDLKKSKDQRNVLIERIHKKSVAKQEMRE